MLRNIATSVAAMTFILTGQVAVAGPLGSTSNLTSITSQDTSQIIRIHSKKCKFYHPDGHTYKDHCPHGVKKGSRKKRALIGAAVGAAVGGAVSGRRGKGALVGAGVGAAAGAASLKRCWYYSGGRKVKVKCRQ